MLDYVYYIIGGQALLYILAALYLTRRIRLKVRENLQLSGKVSALKFKLWNAETKLKNARDHITLLESDAEAFLRRECTYIKNRNKPTDEVMQLKSDNDFLRERLMKSESDRRNLDDKLREQRSTIQWLQSSLSVKPTASDLHAISVQKDSILNQVSVLRTENFALKAKLSMAPNEDAYKQLRAVNKDLTDRLQAMHDANMNKYEEYRALSDEVRILKRSIADLLKENAELKAEHLLW